MPTYLCHGFRWKRPSIRVYVVVQNLDDAAPEWIIKPGTSRALLESFYALFDFLPFCEAPRGGSSILGGSDVPAYVTANGRSQSYNSATRRTTADEPPRRPGQELHDAEDEVLAQDWSKVKVLEEYDPLNLEEVSRPHAYVADYVVRVDLSVSIVDEITKYEERLRGDANPPMAGALSDEGMRSSKKSSSSSSSKKQGWLEKLRDQLQRGEEIRWYVVVNGDEERSWPDEPPARTAAAATAERPAQPTRQQSQHHAQYTHQQLVFEGSDRERELRREKERERLRYELGGDKNILATTSRVADRRRGPAERDQRPVVPDKDATPMMRPRMSSEALRPKTPKGFRRLFGSSKGGD